MMIITTLLAVPTLLPLSAPPSFSTILLYWWDRVERVARRELTVVLKVMLSTRN